MDLPDGVPSKMIKSKEHGLTEVPNYERWESSRQKRVPKNLLACKNFSVQNCAFTILGYSILCPMANTFGKRNNCLQLINFLSEYFQDMGYTSL